MAGTATGTGVRRARSPRVSALLLRWFDRHARPLPWRSDRDPYRIWISEVLLQQTRVRAAVPYYERFLERFPDLGSLARATPAQVLSVWAGAGYYARAWHLLEAAKEIERRHGGSLPRSVEELERLPGVGPYTARAIAALAFDVPVVALEANGRRVAARVTLERADPRRPAIRRRLESVLAAWMPRHRPGAFLEALMEFGESVCTSRRPLCPTCPLRGRCRAFAELDTPEQIPRARRRSPVPHYVAAIVALTRNGSLLLRRRTEPGLLRGLWELPGGKQEPGERLLGTARRELLEETGLPAPRLRSVGVVRHAYSHFSVELHVFRGEAREPQGARHRGLRWVARDRLASFPKPRATEKVIERLGLAGPDRATRTGPFQRGEPSARSGPQPQPREGISRPLP